MSIYKGLCGAAMRSVTTITEPMFSVFLHSTVLVIFRHVMLQWSVAMQCNTI